MLTPIVIGLIVNVLSALTICLAWTRFGPSGPCVECQRRRAKAPEGKAIVFRRASGGEYSNEQRDGRQAVH